MEPVSLAQLESFDPHPVRQGNRARYLCLLSPMCREKPRDSAHRSLSVDTMTGVFYCHRCSEKGKLREFWEERPARKPLIKRTQLRPVAALVSRAIVKTEKTTTKQEKKTDLALLREKMSSFAEQFENSAAEYYLNGREISTEISRLAGCGFAPAWEHWEKKNDEWNLTGTDQRVVFPVRDENGELVAMHSRAITAEHFHSSKITKGNKSRGVFYSSPEVFESPIVAICEGPVDALALASCDIPAVAMIGTTAPKWLARMLRGKSVLIATDADKAGDEAAMKLKMALAPHTKNIFRLRPLHGKDWAEELALAGTKKLREYFTPFAPSADDATRANAAWHFAEQCFYEEAVFLAALISDEELRDTFLTLIHKEHLKAA